MKYLKVFTDFVEDMKELGFAERGRLFTAMLEYAETGEETALPGNERFVWGTAKKNIDNQRKSYDHRCEVNKEIATNRYESLRTDTKDNVSLQDKDKEQDKEQEKSKKRVFVPPTVAEVEEQCRIKGYEHTDPEEFVRFYNSKNWYVGKNKMVAWRDALGNWDSRAIRRGEPKIGETPGRIDKTANLKKLFAELGDD